MFPTMTMCAQGWSFAKPTLKQYKIQTKQQLLFDLDFIYCETISQAVNTPKFFLKIIKPRNTMDKLKDMVSRPMGKRVSVAKWCFDRVSQFKTPLKLTLQPVSGPALLFSL